MATIINKGLRDVSWGQRLAYRFIPYTRGLRKTCSTIAIERKGKESVSLPVIPGEGILLGGAPIKESRIVASLLFQAGLTELPVPKDTDPQTLKRAIHVITDSSVKGMGKKLPIAFGPFEEIAPTLGSKLIRLTRLKASKLPIAAGYLVSAASYWGPVAVVAGALHIPPFLVTLFAGATFHYIYSKYITPRLRARAAAKLIDSGKKPEAREELARKLLEQFPFPDKRDLEIAKLTKRLPADKAKQFKEETRRIIEAVEWLKGLQRIIGAGEWRRAASARAVSVIDEKIKDLSAELPVVIELQKLKENMEMTVVHKEAQAALENYKAGNPVDLDKAQTAVEAALVNADPTSSIVKDLCTLRDEVVRITNDIDFLKKIATHTTEGWIGLPGVFRGDVIEEIGRLLASLDNTLPVAHDLAEARRDIILKSIQATLDDYRDGRPADSNLRKAAAALTVALKDADESLPIIIKLRALEVVIGKINTGNALLEQIMEDQGGSLTLKPKALEIVPDAIAQITDILTGLDAGLPVARGLLKAKTQLETPPALTLEEKIAQSEGTELDKLLRNLYGTGDEELEVKTPEAVRDALLAKLEALKSQPGSEATRILIGNIVEEIEAYLGEKGAG
jgi:hypothetical protein